MDARKSLDKATESGEENEPKEADNSDHASTINPEDANKISIVTKVREELQKTIDSGNSSVITQENNNTPIKIPVLTKACEQPKENDHSENSSVISQESTNTPVKISGVTNAYEENISGNFSVIQENANPLIKVPAVAKACEQPKENDSNNSAVINQENASTFIKTPVVAELCEELKKNSDSDNFFANNQENTNLPIKMSVLAKICEEPVTNGIVHIPENNATPVLQAVENVQPSTDSSQEDEKKLSPAMKKKVEKIYQALITSDVKELNGAAITEYGLILDDIRRKVWPKLIGMDVYATSPRPTLQEIEDHPYYQQVVLDVNRSLKRFPPSIKEKQRLAMQDQLVLLIMRVLVKHPKLHYYQGYHDICVTFLLVLGEEMAFHVVDKLSITHLEVFMRKTMEPTTNMLHYMFPVIEKEKPQLFQFLEKSDVGIMFALSWLITWFGHVLNNYSDVVRLFDLFIASSRWLPVYVASAIVLYREEEIMKQECDMPCVHSLLSHIPDDLPFEDLIDESLLLFEKYPPKSLEKAVRKRVQTKNNILNVNSRQKRIMAAVTKVIHTVLPTKRFAVSVVLAAAVVFSAVLYQTYKS